MPHRPGAASHGAQSALCPAIHSDTPVRARGLRDTRSVTGPEDSPSGTGLGPQTRRGNRAKDPQDPGVSRQGRGRGRRSATGS